MPLERPTITTIARQAGVSPMTVSRALRGERYVEAQTAQRICALARSLGYRPNPSATQLRARRQKKAMEIREYVALLVEKQDPEWARSWKHQGFIRGMQNRAAQFGYRLQLLWVYEPGWSIDRIAKWLHTRNVRASVLFPENYQEIPSDVLKLVDRHSCAVVGSQPVKQPYHFAANDDFSNARNATRLALDHRCKRPGLAVLCKIDELIGRRFSAGFRSVTQDLPPEDQIPPLLLESFDGGALRKWWEEYRPDVIITHNRRVAIEDWLRPLKLSVPKDVGWITLDIVPGDAHIAGIDPRSELVGVAALDLVIDQMQRDESGIPDFQKGVFIEGIWQTGETLSRPRSKRA